MVNTVPSTGSRYMLYFVFWQDTTLTAGLLYGIFAMLEINVGLLCVHNRRPKEMRKKNQLARMRLMKRTVAG